MLKILFSRSANALMSDSLVTQPLLKIATISASASAYQQTQIMPQHHGTSNGHNLLAADGGGGSVHQRRASRPAVLDVQAAAAAAAGNSAECPPPLPAKERSRAENHYIKNKSMQSPTSAKNRVSREGGRDKRSGKRI